MIDDYSGFSHVLDSLNVLAQLPFQLIPDHWFRKAEPQEVQLIKEELTAYVHASLSYEHAIIELGDGRRKSKPLPSDQWRYYVISYSPTNKNIGYIEHAANLLRNDITLGCSFFGSGSARVYNMALISTFFGDRQARIEMPEPIMDDELEQITTNYNLITALDNTRYPNISRAVEDFHQTKSITNRFTLKVLSYFSIIECLLTHPPRPDDRTDSVTRQITSKMCLLSKRFQRELKYDSFFPNIPEPENVWKKLYLYRSLLAHGGDIDFQQKFSTLISTDNIRSFLVESIKLLILYALKEPEFLADFQKC